MNSVQLIGRIASEPSSFTTERGTRIAEFTIVVKKGGVVRPGDKDVDFFRCKAFHNHANQLLERNTKGHLIGITGSLTTRQFTDRHGSKREVVEIVCGTVDLLDKVPALPVEEPEPADAFA